MAMGDSYESCGGHTGCMDCLCVYGVARDPSHSRRLLSGGSTARAKIRLINGTSTDLSDTRIREDSVVGTDPASRATVAFSIRDVSQIESQEYSRSRTLLLGSAIAAAFLGIDLYGVAHQ